MTAWTDFIKEFAKRNNTTYGCALSDPRCAQEYRAKRPQKLTKKAKKENESMGKEDINIKPRPRPPPSPPAQVNPYAEFSVGEEVLYSQTRGYTPAIIRKISPSAITIQLDEEIYSHSYQRGYNSVTVYDFPNTFKGKKIVVKKAKYLTKKKSSNADEFKRAYRTVDMG